MKDKKPGQVVRNNTLVRGFMFLGSAVCSQWKVLLSITAMFIIIVAALAGITMLFPPDGNFIYPEETADTISYGDYFWWVFVTISTIGYGDVYPISTLARFWAIIIGLIGIIFLALFTAVVVNGFTQEFQKRRDAGEEGKTLSLVVKEVETDRKKIRKLKKENGFLRDELNELKIKHGYLDSESKNDISSKNTKNSKSKSEIDKK